MPQIQERLNLFNSWEKNKDNLLGLLVRQSFDILANHGARTRE